MISRMKIILILFIVFCLSSGSSFAQNSYNGSEDKRAIEEAEKAVKRLEKNRGAILINSKVVDIVGIESTSISGSSVGLTKTLVDLGAKKVGEEIQISLSGDVLFDFDKWEIKGEPEETLQKIAAAIKELNKSKVIIEGHTDSKGSESHNLNLSQKRAEAVRDWFISKAGLTDLEFQTKGYGESKPIAQNTNSDGTDNPDGRAKNRRVEIKIKD